MREVLTRRESRQLELLWKRRLLSEEAENLEGEEMANGANSHRSQERMGTRAFHLEDWFTSENTHPFYEIMILSLF